MAKDNKCTLIIEVMGFPWVSFREGAEFEGGGKMMVGMHRRTVRNSASSTTQVGWCMDVHGNQWSINQHRHMCPEASSSFIPQRLMDPPQTAAYASNPSSEGRMGLL